MKLFRVWACVLLLCALVECKEYNMDEKLYMLDIRVPRLRGHSESSVIRNIRKMFFLVKNMKVLFQLKVLGNKKMITIVKVEKDCAWAKLTGLLFDQSVRFQVVALYRCENFASELGIQLNGLSTTFLSSMQITHISFYTAGLSPEEYFEMLRDHMQRTKRMVQAGGMKLTCFRVLAHVPVRMIYFTNFKPSQGTVFMESFDAPERFTMVVRSAMTLRQYKRWCI